MIVEILLPDTLIFQPPSEPIPAQLLEPFHNLPRIGLAINPLNQDMRVVGHKTIRGNLAMGRRRGSFQVRDKRRHDIRIGKRKQPAALGNARRKCDEDITAICLAGQPMPFLANQ